MSNKENAPTQIPMQAVSPDQLPREKALSYDEVATIVGSLYLDSHHQISVMNEQFQAVADEYEKQMYDMQAQIEQRDKRISDLSQRISALEKELEVRDAQSGSTT